LLKKDEEVSWTDRVRNEEVQEESRRRGISYKKKTNWIGHILGRNCLLKHVIEGKKEGRSDGKTRKKTSAANGLP
jgi:hypothetical protein